MLCVSLSHNREFASVRIHIWYLCAANRKFVHFSCLLYVLYTSVYMYMSLFAHQVVDFGCDVTLQFQIYEVI